MGKRERPFSGKEEEKLWAMWNKTQGGEYDLHHVGQWETYDGFLSWMFANGWQEGSMVKRKDVRQPKTPGNCYITTKGNPVERHNWAWEQDFARRWAKAVNPLRRAAGMDLL